MSKLFFIGFSIILWPAAALAAAVKLENPLPINNLFQGSSYIGSVINRGLAIIGAVALLMLIYGGISLILAAGNERKIAQGKEIVTYTAIGLIVIFISYTAISFFVNTLGGQIEYEYNELPIVATTTEPGDTLPGNGAEVPDGEDTCPSGCVKTEPCIGVGQPAECMDQPGCCGLASE